MSTSSKSPVQQFVQLDAGQKATRKQNEIELWHNWNNNGRQPEHLEPLLKAYDPRLNQLVRQWGAPAVHPTAFKAELKKHLIKALETYDPERGAASATHIENRLPKAHRYRNQYQNIRYIPEGKSSLIGPIQRAQDQLEQDFGRPATHDEIADYLGKPLKQISSVIAAKGKDIPASGPLENDPTEHQLPRDQEVIQLLHYELDPHELQVFNHLYGREGAKQLTSTNDLAKQLGKSPSQVSRLKTSIIKKYKQFL